MKPIQALFFDLDDTLLDGSALQGVIVQTCELIAASQARLDASVLLEANGRIWRDYWPTVEKKWEQGSLDGASVSLEAWRRTLRVCGCNDESVAQLASETVSKLGRDAYRLFEDVQPLLGVAKKAQVPLALITNGASDTQREKLRALDLERWFDVVVISGEVGVRKPDPSAFGIAVEKLEVERANAWHVGDSLRTDVGGARAAGIAAVWLNRRALARQEADPEPDLEIHTLSDLMRFLPE